MTVGCFVLVVRFEENRLFSFEKTSENLTKLPKSVPMGIGKAAVGPWR